MFKRIFNLLRFAFLGPKISSWSQGKICNAGSDGIITGAAILGGAALAGSLYSGYQSNKTAKAGIKAGQVDIDALDARARQIAQQNAADSAALEQAMTPEVPRLRQDANNQILSQMNPSGFDEFSQNQLLGLAQSSVGGTQTPLLRAAIAKAKADLAQGGRLSPELQNLVARQGLAKAGTVAPGGLGMGRDIVARDLGLTSLDLERQRLTAASQLGGQELAMESQDANTSFNNRANILNAVNMLQGVQGNQFQRALAAGQYGQSIRPPVVGLDPGSVVDLTTGNATNRSAGLASQANIYGAQAQGYGQLAGQALGYGLLSYNNSKTPSGNSGGYIDPSTGQWIN